MIKKFLYILLAVDIIAIVLFFFLTIANSPVYSIIITLISILGLSPIFALIYCLDYIEDLKYTQNKLLSKVKKLEDTLEETDNVEIFSEANTYPAKSNHIDSAKAVWECVKCGTVNKANTNHCSNCKAPYSPFINPTSDPNAKKKISRWVKYK